MISPIPSPRSFARTAALTSALLLLVGCTPDPSPSPTPTPAFASEEDAFAAAEATYRAYNDSSNARRAGGADASPADYLIGDALEADQEATDYLREAGLRLTGEVQIVSFQGVEAAVDGDRLSVTAVVCLDSSATRVVDADGNDATPPSRNTVVALTAHMIAVDETFRIEQEREEGTEQC
ncbi:MULTISPECIES: hypothetical protein [unclassified Microbacterium]|uniref:hypothetical protein n=1 Tax=unclassified Microbacterium TaxID=2609290 RepID=UPI00109CBD41|nr:MULTISPECIES: hypothetical protein [unclassified Microbacterium]